jgi:hypothetical protein
MARILLTIDVDEAEELYRFLEHQYVSPTAYPRLGRLWTRISTALRKQEQLLAASPDREPPSEPPAATA